MIRALALALLLTGCAAREYIVATIAPPPRAEPVAPLVVAEAERTQAKAAKVAKERDDLSNADLIRMLRLSGEMRRAVRQMRAHPTAANIAAARAAIGELRGALR